MIQSVKTFRTNRTFQFVIVLLKYSFSWQEITCLVLEKKCKPFFIKVWSFSQTVKVSQSFVVGSSFCYLRWLWPVNKTTCVFSVIIVNIALKYLSRPYHFKFFKGCLSQISLGPFLITLSQMYLSRIVNMFCNDKNTKLGVHLGKFTIKCDKIWLLIITS